eukprot:jgi/Bigna1/88806/estExt_fgenesh1_pg.C_380117
MADQYNLDMLPEDERAEAKMALEEKLRKDERMNEKRKAMLLELLRSFTGPGCKSLMLARTSKLVTPAQIATCTGAARQHALLDCAKLGKSSGMPARMSQRCIDRADWSKAQRARKKKAEGQKPARVMEGTPVPGSRSFNPPHSRYGSFDSATHASSEIVDVSLEDDWTAFMDTKQPAEKEVRFHLISSEIMTHCSASRSVPGNMPADAGWTSLRSGGERPRRSCSRYVSKGAQRHFVKPHARARLLENSRRRVATEQAFSTANRFEMLYALVNHRKGILECYRSIHWLRSRVGAPNSLSASRRGWEATPVQVSAVLNCPWLFFLCSRSSSSGAYAQRAVFLATLITIPCSILQLNASSILKLMNQPDDLAELAGEYCVRCIPQLYFMLLFTIMQRLMQALNFNWTNFAVCLTVCVLSPGILYFFIGFLGWGYIGAGWGASVYTFLYLCLSIPAMIYQGQGYLFEFEGPSVFDSERIKEYILLAVPGTLQMCLEWWVLEMISLFAGMLPNPSVTIGASYIGMSTGVVVSMILAAVIFTYRESLVTFYTNNARCLVTPATMLLGALTSEKGGTLPYRRILISRLGERTVDVVLCVANEGIRPSVSFAVLHVFALCVVRSLGYYGLAVPIAVTCVFFYTPKRPILYLWSGVALAMASSCVMQLSFLSKYDWGLSIKGKSMISTAMEIDSTPHPHAQERLSTRRHRGEHEDGGMEEDLSFDLDASTIAGGDSDATISL